jgi:hypothetical protein
MKTIFQVLILSCFCNFAQAQEITISGIISDDSSPLPGANVIEKGTTNATTTDFVGNYEIGTKVGRTLVISYVGYKTKEVIVTDTPTIDVVLEGDTTLDEIVIRGYGIKHEKKALGYVVSSTSEGDVSRVLSGKASGVGISGSADTHHIANDPQSGQLTAAEVNDLEKWAEWMKITAFGEAKTIAEKWQFVFENRFHSQVKDRFGNPANNTKVTLYKNRTPIMKGRTDVYGNLTLFKGDKTAKDSFMVQIYQGEELLGKSLSNTQKEVSFTLKNARQNNDIDIMFTVDATGSMGDEIAYLKSELKNIMSRIDTSIEQKRVALTFYRDHGDQYVTRSFDFESDIDIVKVQLDLQAANAGGDYEEAEEEALRVSLAQSWNDQARSKLMFLMLDAPPHFTEKNVAMIKAQIKKAQEQGIRIIPVVASGANKNVEFLMRFFSVSTNGTYVFLTDDSGIGNSHIEATTEDFKVEKLNDLIVRLIEKYAGVTAAAV